MFTLKPRPFFVVCLAAVILFASCRTKKSDRQTESAPAPAPKPDFFAIEGAATVAAGQCERYDVVLRAALTEMEAFRDYTMALSAAPEGHLFTDSGCGHAASEVVLPAGRSRVAFYFRGDRGGKVTLTVRSDGSELAAGALSIAVTARAVVAFTQANLDFGPMAVGDETVLSVSIRNTGLGEARSLNQALPALAFPFTFAGGAYPGAGGTCESSLSAGETCTLTLKFSPQTVGLFSSSLKLTFSDDFEGGEAVLSVLGEGGRVSSADLLRDNPDALAFGMEEFTEGSEVRPLADGRSMLTTRVFDGENHILTMALFNQYGERDFTFGNHGSLQVMLPGDLDQFQQMVWRPDNRVWLLRTPAATGDGE